MEESVPALDESAPVESTSVTEEVAPPLAPPVAPPVAPPAATPAGAERRQHVRKPLRGAAYMLFANQQPMRVSMLDISSGGMGIVAPVNLPTNVRCMARFFVPLRAGQSVTCDTQVAVLHSVYSSRENGFKIGVQFASPPPQVLQAITAYLKLQ